MTALVFTDKAALHYAPAISRIAPELDICTLDDPASARAEVAISWAPPAESYARLPGLRLIHSIGAGADRIISSASNLQVPICRIVDASQARSMAQYVVWGVLNRHRGFDGIRANQRAIQWQRVPGRSAPGTVVGIMGMGLMGKTVATLLLQLGFTVRGWSRRGTEMAGVQGYAEGQLDEFLAGTQILVCLLPLTPATRQILSRDLFARLAEDAYVIHVGRGDQLHVGDLLAAVDGGRLGGALLDVFPVEPLPADDGLWRHEKIIVTPHVAAISDAGVVATQIVDNVRRLSDGQPLQHQVQHALGY